MYENAGMFVADWRDESGKRLRKRFKNPVDAQRHEHEQTALTHATLASQNLDLAVHHTQRKGEKRQALERKVMEIVKRSRGIQRSA